MIPDFKTYLKESVWNDIRKKSLGKEERVESSVNNLQTEELLDYLNDYYTETNTPKGSRIFQINDDDITINVLQPHRGQPSRLHCPWDSPGKNTGLGCHFLAGGHEIGRASCRERV